MSSERVIRRREGKIRRIVHSIVGERVTDGGQRGTLVRCEKCGGGGLLHKLDADVLAAMKQRARETPPMTTDRGSGIGIAGDIDGEKR